jgi:hypothetical protein
VYFKVIFCKTNPPELQKTGVFCTLSTLGFALFAAGEVVGLGRIKEWVGRK